MRFAGAAAKLAKSARVRAGALDATSALIAAAAAYGGIAAEHDIADASVEIFHARKSICLPSLAAYLLIINAHGFGVGDGRC